MQKEVMIIKEDEANDLTKGSCSQRVKKILNH
jgi:hypothetical protein